MRPQWCCGADKVDLSAVFRGWWWRRTGALTCWWRKSSSSKTNWRNRVWTCWSCRARWGSTHQQLHPLNLSQRAPVASESQDNSTLNYKTILGLPRTCHFLIDGIVTSPCDPFRLHIKEKNHTDGEMRRQRLEERQTRPQPHQVRNQTAATTQTKTSS